jgi:predicted GNAT family acetyltransferase
MPEPPPDAAPDPIPDPTTEISVVNNVAGHRYEAWLGEVLAGFSQYRLDDDVITFIHTQVADAFEGKGVASTLIRAALDDVRAEGSRRVRPLCPFVRAFIQRHEDYQDLLPAGNRLA